MNQLASAIRSRGSSQKRINVPRVNDPSTRASQASYRYETGDINWGGRKAVAIIIGALPDKIGFFADHLLNTLVTEILAADPNLSAEADALQVFVSTPPGLRVAPWRSFNVLVDGDREVSVVGSARTVTGEVTQQLEAIFEQ